MPVLTVTVLGDRVEAAADGSRASADLAVTTAPPGTEEVALEVVWRAVLSAVGAMLEQVPAGDLTGLRLQGPDRSLALWDVETLGAPRAALGPGDGRLGAPGSDAAWPGTAPGWLAAHEPHTWALVEEGVYALGPLASYLLARATRGTWHAVDRAWARTTALWDEDAGAWSAAAVRAAGLPREALPEPLPAVAAGEPTGPVTEARVLLGLALPVLA